MASGDILSVLADKGTLDLTKTDTTAIRNTLGEFSGGGGIESNVVEMLQELLTQPKVIKHIQRGKVTTSSSGANSATVELAGFTNIDKMIVLLDGDAFFGNSVYSSVYVDSLSLTQLKTLKATGGSYSYQVIEFC